jgi:hypothetical protein
MGDAGSYLYAVSRGLSDADLGGALGLRQRPLRVVQHGGLCAVVSDVDLDEFGDEGLREHLEDLAWLEEVARTHDAVVAAAASVAPTAPLRLATICLSDDRVRERLDAWHDPLLRALGRIEGRKEWSVKAFAPRPASPQSASPQTTSPAHPGAGAGAAYLQRRRAETTERELAAQAAADLADQLHATLSRQVTASRRLAPQDQRLTGHQRTMILNGAYLVDDADTAAFRAAVQALDYAHPDAGIDVQGPWPPYSFVSLEDA